MLDGKLQADHAGRRPRNRALPCIGAPSTTRGSRLDRGRNGPFRRRTPPAVAVAIRITRRYDPPLVLSTNAILLPSSEMIGEVVTAPPSPVT